MSLAVRSSNHTSTSFVAKAPLLVMFATSVASVAARGQQTNVALDGNSKGRVFNGLGAASASESSRLLIDYPEPQ
jgi:hypothetical protein